MAVPQKIKLRTKHPAIPLLGTYPKEPKAESQADSRGPVLTAALFKGRSKPSVRQWMDGQPSVRQWMDE